jgi:hypothetical protein
MTAERAGRALAVLTALACASPARAQPADDAPARVAVIVVGENGDAVPSSTRATLQVSFERALGDDPRLDILDQDAELLRRAGAVPTEQISEARGLVTAGRTLLERGKASAAQGRLVAAREQLARVLTWVSKRELADAQYLLGAAQAITGDEQAALATFTALRSWRPDLEADPDLAPETVLPVWDQAVRQAAALPRGALQIDATPDGAMAYVDGTFAGFTPTTVEDLPAGTHYVTVRRQGWRRAVVPVTVRKRSRQPVAVTLEPTPGYDELVALVDELGPDMGAAQPPARVQAALGDLSELLDADHLVALVVPTGGGPLRAHVHAVEGGALLATSQLDFGERDPEEAFGELARALYDQVAFDADEPAETVRRTDPSARTAPVWRRWWFWTGVGAVAVLGVTLPLVLSGGDGGPSCPSSSGCGSVVLRF